MRALLFALCLSTTTLMGASQSIPLFPKGVPGASQNLSPEKDMTSAKDNLVAGRAVIRLGNVTEPSLRFYPAPKSGNTGATVVVFPGGGYNILAYDLEGTEVCDWLNSIRVNCVVVKYRVPEPKNVPRYEEPLQDAQRALSYVRSRAAEWHIDPHRIGVLGFSAGGHLAVMISNNYEKRTYPVQDSADEVSCRPDFAILIYPAYLANGEKLDILAPEIQITSNTPPSFLVQTEDDPVHVENSLVYYRALKDQKVPAEMHLFSTGGHGYGLRPDSKKPVTQWPALAQAWLTSRGIIP
jgi:acetyl esterase/lipase